MNPSYASYMLHISYWEFFEKYYTPLLRELDVLLKSIEAPISTAETARALVMEQETVEKIMAQENIRLIDRDSFLRILMQGNSSLCRLMQRECLCGSPDRYSPAHIAYIYGLQDGNVEAVCRENGYKEVPADSIPDLLSKIYIFFLP